MNCMLCLFGYHDWTCPKDKNYAFNYCQHCMCLRNFESQFKVMSIKPFIIRSLCNGETFKWTFTGRDEVNHGYEWQLV